MNRQIVRMFAFFAVLFGTLVGFSSYWAVFDADDLKGNKSNRRTLLDQQTVPRGLILASGGTLLAKNKEKTVGTRRFYSRVYPTANLFAHPMGYNYVDLGRSGLEQSYNDDLVGETNELEDVINELRGRRDEGRELRTTLRPDAQRTALQALAGRRGAVVALEVESGAVAVMASEPTFDPNGLPEKFQKLSKEKSSPLLNRTTQGKYPPGSIFKVVTASAAIDSGKFTTSSMLDGSSPQIFATKELKNFANKDFGKIPLSEALTRSVNTAFANIGVELGKNQLLKYMDRFGFNAKPGIDLPDDEQAISGIYRGGKRLGNRDVIDVARVAIGQGGLLATPLQMTMVAQTIANGGEVLRPYIVREVVDSDGRSHSKREPKSMGRAVKTSTATEVKELMLNVVRSGTGVAAQIPGIEVAGKTGTAEITQGGDVNQAWFMAFAPAKKPRYAVVATVERTTGEGGTIAAPMVKQVMEKLL